MSKTSIRRKTFAGVGGALVALSLLGTTPAVAKSASTTGSKIYTYKKEGHQYAYVKDTKADKRAAYGKYERSASAGKIRALWNKSGSGTTAKSGKGSKIIKMRACRQEQWKPDSCSNWTAN
ncbi:hypothetical protein [Streptomyces sp. ODS28]|uniref:hypothetical protein n=1 Tax=Streptomyces sp. ODS28 TaxID=3136688 RepID=UPI0031E60FEB